MTAAEPASPAPPDPTRRRIIGLLATIAAGAPVLHACASDPSPFGSRSSGSRPPHTLATSDPATERSIERIGRAYLAENPDDADTAALWASEPSDRVDLVDLEAAVRHDFATGAVVSVDGWLLARSEARAAALAALRA